MAHELVLRSAGAKAYAALAAVLCAVFLAFFGWTVVDGQFNVFPALGAILSAQLVWRGTAGSKVTVAGGRLSFPRVLRTRRLPVQDVADIVVGKSAGLPRAFVVRADGKRLPLPAPGGWWPARDPAFEENVLLLRRALGLPVPG